MEFCRFIKENKIIDASNIQEAEKIIALYRGELFIDFEDLWVEEKRQWAAVRIEELIIKTAAYYLSCKKDRDAERLLLRLVEINPLLEQGYTLLMDLYAECEDRINFELYYRRYINLMRELREPVNNKYAVLYEKIRAQSMRKLR